MISEIRNYFKSSILEIDSELTQHDQYFNSENISDRKIEDTFFIEIGALSSSREDVSMNGELSVNVTIWKNGYTDVIENLDMAYCNAIEIQAKLENQERLSNLTFIKSVTGSLIEPTAMPDNDNMAKFSLEFTVMVKYKSLTI